MTMTQVATLPPITPRMWNDVAADDDFPNLAGVLVDLTNERAYCLDGFIAARVPIIVLEETDTDDFVLIPTAVMADVHEAILPGSPIPLLHDADNDTWQVRYSMIGSAEDGTITFDRPIGNPSTIATTIQKSRETFRKAASAGDVGSQLRFPILSAEFLHDLIGVTSSSIGARMSGVGHYLDIGYDGMNDAVRIDVYPTSGPDVAVMETIIMPMVRPKDRWGDTDV